MVDAATKADKLDIAVATLVLIAAKCEERPSDPFAAEVHATAIAALDEILGKEGMETLAKEVARRYCLD